jgi:GNAT superfamily N-acetyltransferase
VEVRPLREDELELVGARLPLNRLGGGGTYFVAWDGGDPVGHAHVSWQKTTLGIPEIQDVFVLAERRREGIGTELSLAAERLTIERGLDRLSIGASVENEGALRLYKRLGFVDSGLSPQRVRGTVQVRSGPLEVDDTLVYLVKELAANG